MSDEDEAAKAAATEAAGNLEKAQTELAAIQLAVVNERKVLKATRKGDDGQNSGDPSEGVKLRKELAELTAKNKALELGVDHEEVKKLAADLNKTEAEQAAATIKAKSDALDETKESLTDLVGRHESLLYETKATPLLLSKEKIGVRPDALEEALEQVQKHFELKDGRFVLRDATAHELLRDKEGDPVTLDGFGPFLRKIKPFYFDALSGAGSQASDGRPSINGTMNVEDIGNMSPAEYKKVRAEGQLPKRF